MATAGDMGDFSTNASGQFQATNAVFGQIAPVVNQFSQADSYTNTLNAKPIVSTASPSDMQAFMGKLSSIGSEGAHLAGGVVDWIGKAAVDTVEAPFKLADSGYHVGAELVDQHNLSSEETRLNSESDNLNNLYRQGKISLAQYNASIKTNQDSYGKLADSWRTTNARMSTDNKTLRSSAVTTDEDLIGLVTAGASDAAMGGIEKIAPGVSDYLKTNQVSQFLLKGSEQIEGALRSASSITSKVSVLDNSWAKQVVQDTANSALGNVGKDMTSSEIAKNVATNLLFKRPLVYQSVAGTASQVYDELQQGKYGPAMGNLALMASMSLAGGPIGLALKQAGKAGTAIKSLFFGETSFMDELSSRVGDNNAQGIFNALHDNFTRGDGDMARNFKVMEETNMRAANGNAAQAVDRVVGYLQGELGWDLGNMTHEQLVTDMNNFAVSRDLAVKDAIKHGLSTDDANRITVGRWSIQDNAKLQNILATADQQAGTDFATKVAARRSAIQELQNRYGRNAAWLNNGNLQQQIDSIISTTKDTKEMTESIRGIDAQSELTNVSPSVRRELASRGYIAIEPKSVDSPYVKFEDTNGRLTTRYANQAKIPGEPASTIFHQAVQPVPVFSHIGAFLTSVGMSPEGGQGLVMRTFNQNLAQELPKALNTKPFVGEDPEEYGKEITQKLSDWMKSSTKQSKVLFPVTDYRQMTVKDIQEALNVTAEEAKNVRGAVNTAMLRVPLQIRGLGDKINDFNYKMNPLAGKYARVQAAGRFVFNPFFRWQQSTQTEMLSQLEVGGKFPTYGVTDKVAQWLFPERYKTLDDTVGALKSTGILGQDLNEFAGGEAAGSFGAAAGQVGTHLLKGEERSLAGMTQVMAEHAGMNVHDFIDQYHDTVVDTLRSIVTYPKSGDFINSPLARTLNFAFFPSRYNMKVAGLMAKQISQFSAPMQVALIKGMFNFSSFLKSDEGQVWYSQNSDVIQLMTYITPLYSLQYVMNALQGVSEGQVGQLGSLGGLPFGFISQMLDSQGITHFNTPYVEPKTGEVVPNYVPNDTKGRLANAIGDLLGTVFTYPGATAGLPSKGKALRSVGNGLTGATTSKDYTSVTPTNLTPQEQHYSDLMQSQTNGTGATHPDGTPVNHFMGPATPATTLRIGEPATNIGYTPTAPKEPKKKKADYTPALLPGQTQLGQL